MTKKSLTCIECPIGCDISVTIMDGKVTEVVGNSCPRGKVYAENEVISPKRVVTSTIRLDSGEMVAVKTSCPINKSDIFKVMQIINETTASKPVKIGDTIIENIVEGANLIASGNAL